MNLSNKLSKCNDSLTVNMYDNGFMVEVGGRDSNDDWKNAKIIGSEQDATVRIVFVLH